MSQRRAAPTEPSEQLTKPLRERESQDRIEAALQRMAIRLDKVLSESIINQWYEDLGSYPIVAIEYAANECGEYLDRWPKWKQFKSYLTAWMDKCEERDKESPIPSPEEIQRRRREFKEWYDSPQANEVRQMVSALDKKMNEGRPRLYTQEEIERFRRKRKK